MENIKITSASMTDIGKRKENEDYHIVIPHDKLSNKCDAIYILADGMGGMESGAEASEIASETVKKVLLQEIDRQSDIIELLRKALKAANTAVYHESQIDPGLKKMGTTCVASVINNGKLYYAHLGDSRAYLIRNAEIIALTTDHSFIAEKIKSGELTEEQGRKSRFRNIITKAVGLHPDVEPDVNSIDLQQGDILLLCTDGLTVPIPETKIKEILLSTSISEIDAVCSKLIKSALDAGGKDNITLIISVYGAMKSPAKSPISDESPVMRQKKPSWIPALLIGIIIGLAIGIFFNKQISEKMNKLKTENIKTSGTIAEDQVIYKDPVTILASRIQGGILAIDNDDTIHIADSLGQMIQIDIKTNEIYTAPAKPELIPQTITDPAYMAASDKYGNIYITDLSRKAIIKYRKNSIVKEVIAEGKLVKPQAIAVDDSGIIYVVDDNRLKAIKPKNETISNDLTNNKQ